MAMKMLESLFGHSGGGRRGEHYHTLYDYGYISSDLLSLAGRMQAAEDRGELDKLGLEPELLEKRRAAGRGEPPSGASRICETLVLPSCSDRIPGTSACKIGGTASATSSASPASAWTRAVKLSCDFADGLDHLTTGGGMKGASGGKGTAVTDELPEDFVKEFIRDYFGIEAIEHGLRHVRDHQTRAHAAAAKGFYHVMPFR